MSNFEYIYELNKSNFPDDCRVQKYNRPDMVEIKVVGKDESIFIDAGTLVYYMRYFEHAPHLNKIPVQNLKITDYFIWDGHYLMVEKIDIHS